MQRVISNIEVKDKPWITPDGTSMYNVTVFFDGGGKIHCNAKSQNPPYGAGDSVMVEVKGKTPWGDDKGGVKKVDGGGYTPSATQSPPVGAEVASRPFDDDRDKKMRDGMQCNMMSRLVASGKSVDEAHQLSTAIIAKVEGVVPATVADGDGSDIPF